MSADKLEIERLEEFIKGAYMALATEQDRAEAAEAKLADHLAAHKTADAHDCAEMEEECARLAAQLAEAQTPCRCDHSDRTLCCADAEGMLCVCVLAAERAKLAEAQRRGDSEHSRAESLARSNYTNTARIDKAMEIDSDARHAEGKRLGFSAAGSNGAITLLLHRFAAERAKTAEATRRAEWAENEVRQCDGHAYLRDQAEAANARNAKLVEALEGFATVHLCPAKGSGQTPCCGKTPFELSSIDRLTLDSTLVTCDAAAKASDGLRNNNSDFEVAFLDAYLDHFKSLRADRERLREVKAELAAAREDNRKLREALEQIKLGEGPYDRDVFMHACKTIDAMKAVAVSALAAAKTSEEKP